MCAYCKVLPVFYNVAIKFTLVFVFFMVLVMWWALGMRWNTQHCQPSVFCTGWEGGCSNELKELIDGNWRDRSLRTAIGRRSHNSILISWLQSRHKLAVFLMDPFRPTAPTGIPHTDLLKQALSCCSCSHISSTFFFCQIVRLKSLLCHLVTCESRKQHCLNTAFLQYTASVLIYLPLNCRLVV